MVVCQNNIRQAKHAYSMSIDKPVGGASGSEPNTIGPSALRPSSLVHHNVLNETEPRRPRVGPPENQL